MTRKKLLIISELIIAVFLSFILIRMLKGPWISGSVVYNRFIWFIMAPVLGLRGISNQLAFIIAYVLMWIFVGVCKSIVILDRRTLLFVAFWAIIGMIPFIPRGFSVFSLADFSGRSISPFGLLMLYALLVGSYFLIFRYYFGQRIWLSAWWTILISLLITLMNTVFNLAPGLTGQPFLYSLNYTIHRLMNLVNILPVLVFITCCIIFVICLRYIHRNFINGRRKHYFSVWMTPSLLTVMLLIFFGIVRNDLDRYRKFNYRQGINTIFMGKSEDHIMTWCNNRHFGFLLNSVKLIYPFTMQPLIDSLHSHGARLSHLTVIEGIDYFCFERILKVLAYGNRDTILYEKIKPVLNAGYYHPASLRTIINDVIARYKDEDLDITINGRVMFNDKPLTHNLIQVAFFNGNTSLPVWIARTNDHGDFSFACFNPDSDNYSLTLHLMLPDTLLKGRIRSIELVNIPPQITQSGNYQLDTFKLNVIKDREEIKIFEVHIYARTALSGCRLTLPEGFSAPSRIVGRVSNRGTLEIMDYYSPVDDSAEIDQELRREVRNWRFNSATPDDNQIEVYLNYNREQ